jgi:hypothetical protein
MQATLLQRGGGDQGRIERAAIRINRLIDDLLDVTRMEAGRLTIEAVDLLAEQVILDSLEAQQTLASSSSFALRLDVIPDLPKIRADRDRLLQRRDYFLLYCAGRAPGVELCHEAPGKPTSNSRLSPRCSYHRGRPLRDPSPSVITTSV